MIFEILSSVQLEEALSNCARQMERQLLQMQEHNVLLRFLSQKTLDYKSCENQYVYSIGNKVLNYL